MGEMKVMSNKWFLRWSFECRLKGSFCLIKLAPIVCYGNYISVRVGKGLLADLRELI
jgi:hypothetical protein